MTEFLVARDSNSRNFRYPVCQRAGKRRDTILRLRAPRRPGILSYRIGAAEIDGDIAPSLLGRESVGIRHNIAQSCQGEPLARGGRSAQGGLRSCPSPHSVHRRTQQGADAQQSHGPCRGRRRGGAVWGSWYSLKARGFFQGVVSNRPYAAILAAYESGSPVKERAMQQPKTKHDRSAYEQAVDRLASAMREMLGMGPAEDGNAASGEPETAAGQDRVEKST
jgi:hypothetical protein